MAKTNKENKGKHRSPRFLVHNFGISKTVQIGKHSILLPRDGNIVVDNKEIITYLKENEKLYQLKITEIKGD